MRRIPEKLLDVTLQPLMFVLLCAFVFGGVIHVPDGNYREYVAHAVAGSVCWLLFACACIWLGTLVGVLARSPDSVQGVAFLTVSPLTFLASTFVPADGLPDGLRQIAEWNPISAVVAATRTLFGNPVALPSDAPWPLQHAVLAATLWSVAILAVAAPLCIRRFQSRTTD